MAQYRSVNWKACIKQPQHSEEGIFVLSLLSMCKSALFVKFYVILLNFEVQPDATYSNELFGHIHRQLQVLSI